MVDVAAEYVLLAARAARLLPGLAEVPPDACRVVAAEPRPSASALVRAAGRLALAVPDAGLDPPRARFLTAQLGALECTARRLAGQELSPVEEVRATFGVTVEPGVEDRYRRAHVELGDLLPGRGSLARRAAAHRRRDEVPPARLLPTAWALADALRARLPRAEGQVDWRLVADAPWTALHTWSGAGRSVVALSLGARLRWGQLPGLVAHEAWPGHHVQRCRAERGTPERRVVLVRGPQSVVMEGAAEEGLEVLVGSAWGAWAREVLGERGIDWALAERLAGVDRVLRRARLDAALMLPGRPDQAVRHLRRWLLVDEARARRIVGGLATPLWRGYVAAHVEGPPMVRRWLRAGTDVQRRYGRLLDEPLLPEDLRQPGGAAAPGAIGASTRGPARWSDQRRHLGSAVGLAR